MPCSSVFWRRLWACSQVPAGRNPTKNGWPRHPLPGKKSLALQNRRGKKRLLSHMRVVEARTFCSLEPAYPLPAIGRQFSESDRWPALRVQENGSSVSRGTLLYQGTAQRRMPLLHCRGLHRETGESRRHYPQRRLTAMRLTAILTSGTVCPIFGLASRMLFS